MKTRKTYVAWLAAGLIVTIPWMSALASDPGPGGVPTATNVYDVGQPYQESFENFVPGEEVFLDGSYGWYGSTNVFSGDNTVYVTNKTYSWGNNYPIGLNNPTNAIDTTRSNVLYISGWVTNRFAQTAEKEDQVYIDMMIKPLRSYEPEITVHDQVEDDVQMAAYVNSNGHLVVWHSKVVEGAPVNAWTTLDHWPIDTNDWARLTVEMDYNSQGTSFNFFQLRLNESTEFYHEDAFSDPSGTAMGGTYFLAADAVGDPRPYLSDISFSGDLTYLDDLVVQTENPFPEFKFISVVNHTPGFGHIEGNPGVIPGGDREFQFHPFAGYGIYQVDVKEDDVWTTYFQGPQAFQFTSVDDDTDELEVTFGPTIEAAKSSAPSSIADRNAGILPPPQWESFATNSPHYDPQTLSFTLAYPLGSDVDNTVWADEGYHIVSVTTNGHPVAVGGQTNLFGQFSVSYKTNFVHTWNNLDVWGAGTGSVLAVEFDIDKYDMTIESPNSFGRFHVIDSEHNTARQKPGDQFTATSVVYQRTFDWNTELVATVAQTPVNLTAPGFPSSMGHATQYVVIGWSAEGNALLEAEQTGYEDENLPNFDQGIYWHTNRNTQTPAYNFTEDASVVFHWATNYWLQTGQDGSGSITMEIESDGHPVDDGWVAKDQVVRITANPDGPPAFFLGWGGDTNGASFQGADDEIMIVSMDQARYITADFNIKTMTVTSEHGGADPETATYLSDATVPDHIITNSPVVDPTNVKYTVNGWIGTGTVPAYQEGVDDPALMPGYSPIEVDSSITWQWDTEYWFSVEAGANGSIAIQPPHDGGMIGVSEGPWWQDAELKYKADLGFGQGYGPHYWSKDRNDQYLFATVIDAGGALFSIPALMAANDAGDVSPIASAYYDDLYGNNWKGGAISADLERILAGNAYPHHAHASLPVTAPWTTNAPSPTVFEIMHDDATDLAMDGLDFGSDSQYLYSNIASPSDGQPTIRRWNVVGNLDENTVGLTLDNVYTTSVSRIRNLAVYGIDGTDLVFYGEGVGGGTVYAFDPSAETEHLLVDDSALVSGDIMNVKVAGIGLGQMHLYVQHNDGLQIYRLNSDGKSTDGLVQSFTVAELEVVLEDTWPNLRAFEVTNDESHAFFGHQGDPDGLNVVWAAPKFTAGELWVAENANVTVDAVPDPGYQVEMWYGDTQGDVTADEMTVTMNQARFLNVTFVGVPQELSVTSHWGGVWFDGEFVDTGFVTNYPYNTPLGASMVTNSPLLDAAGYTQYVAIGWTASGSAPSPAAPIQPPDPYWVTQQTSMDAFTITEPSEITWNWDTNVWLDLVIDGLDGTMTATTTNGAPLAGAEDVKDFMSWIALDTELVLTVTPTNGYSFRTWRGDTDGIVGELTDLEITVPMDRARTLYASFSHHTLDVVSQYGTVELDGTAVFTNAVNVPSLHTASYPFETVFTNIVLTPTVAMGATQYVAQGWVAEGNVSDPAPVENPLYYYEPQSTQTVDIVLEDSAILWQWATNYWLATSVSAYGGSGGVTVSNLMTGGLTNAFPLENTGITDWVGAETEVQITPIPSSGSHFRYWTGDVPAGSEADDPLVVTMDQARSIEAAFYVTTNYYHVDLDAPAPAEPYASWDTAATNIQAAIDRAQADAAADAGLVAIVMVTNGTYHIGSAIEVTATDASRFVMRSMNGAEATILDGGNSDRVLFVNDADVTVEGFTIRGGLTSDTGGGGARIGSNGGRIRYSIFTDNVSSNTAAFSGGGGLHMRAGIVENSLFYNNHAAYGGGGIYMESAAEIRNCTIVHNEADAVAGGLYSTAAGSVYNSIIRFNTAPENAEVSVDYTTLMIEYTATSDPSEHEGQFGGTDGTNILLDDPIFQDAAAFNYRATGASPTIDAGSTNYVWITGDMVDLDGNPRVVAVTGAVALVDMGAYEVQSRPLTLVGLVASNKVYDGTTQAWIADFGVLDGYDSGDDVTLDTDGFEAHFETHAAGTNLTVTVTGLTLAGEDADKYHLSKQTTTADIDALELTVGGSFEVADRVYDGTAEAMIAVTNLALETVISGDDVTLMPVAGFADATVGTNKTVSLTAATELAGDDAGNYLLSLVGAPTTTAAIGNKSLGVLNAVAADKVYDGTDVAIIMDAVLDEDDVIDGDDVELDDLLGVFAQATVGTNIQVTAQLTLTGAQAPNYAIVQPVGLMADITPRELWVTNAVADNKAYDGTTDATISGAELVNAVPGDDVELDALVGTFAQAEIGTNIAVTAALTIKGVDAGNYSLTQPTGLTADILGFTQVRNTPIAWYEDNQIEPADYGFDTYEELDEHDPFGKGMPLWQEYIAGTDPNDPDSIFRVLEVTILPAQKPSIKWWGGTHGPVRPYIIQKTASLDADPVVWVNVEDVPRQEGEHVWEGEEEPGNVFFYRVLALPDEE